MFNMNDIIGSQIILILCIIIIIETVFKKSFFHKFLRYRDGLKHEEKSIRLSFKEFIKYYNLNPDKYIDVNIGNRKLMPQILKDHYNHFDEIEYTFGIIAYITGNNDCYNCDIYIITFKTFLDFLKYIHFVKVQSKQKRLNDYTNYNAAYYKAVLSDIERMKAQAKAEINKSIEITDSVKSALIEKNNKGVVNEVGNLMRRWYKIRIL